MYAQYALPVHVQLPSRTAQFEWAGNCVWMGSLTLSAHAMACGFEVTTDVLGDTYLLSFPTGRAWGEVVCGAQVVRMEAGQRGVLISPGSSVTARLADDYEGVQMTVGTRDLAQAFETLSGVPLKGLLVFEPCYAFATSPVAAFHRLLGFVLEELNLDDGVLQSPLVAARHAEALLFRLLLTQPHDHSALLHQQTKPVEPKHVRDVAEFLEANLARPICMAELAALSGMSVRALQAGFRKYRGQSPLEFLRMRRLNRARQLLLCRDRSSVSEVALACGFEHFGRFSVHYRAHYGESPSETNAKARARKLA